MTAERLARWMMMLEDASLSDCDDDCGGYAPDDVDRVREEIRQAWVDAVQKETA